MEIFFRLNENETNKDINNFTLAYNIYKECEKLPQLNARVVADMILRQCTEDDFQASILYASEERQGE